METIDDYSLFKILLVGEEKVGKTGISHRYINNVFDENYSPKIYII